MNLLVIASFVNHFKIVALSYWFFIYANTDNADSHKANAFANDL